ncbi:MAG: YkvA family protein [Amphritea sp.]
MMGTTNNEYSQHYSEKGLWKKVSGLVKGAGKKALIPALKLYYAAQDSETPAWAKTTVYAALGYLIFPADVVPDLIPVVGYSDDVVVLLAAVGTIGANITQEHRDKANATVRQWLG